MSHSLIIHVSSSLVLENERITADNLCFDTIQVEIPLMDYFKDSDSLREDDLKWIGAELAKVGFKLNREEITMTVDTSFIDKRSEEHTSELQSRQYLVCRLLLEKKKQPSSFP